MEGTEEKVDIRMQWGVKVEEKNVKRKLYGKMVNGMMCPRRVRFRCARVPCLVRDEVYFYENLLIASKCLLIVY